MSAESRTFFGIQWGGWYFLYNTLPFGWKISPYVYHSVGLMATNFFRSIGVPCSLYIDDRYNGELQVSHADPVYSTFKTGNECNLAAAETATFLVAHYLISLRYFLGLSKSILSPQKMVPYLRFLSDSSRAAFRLIPEEKEKFLHLIRETVSWSIISVKTLQRLVGKCVSLSIAVPAALLFTREMNNTIFKGLRTSCPVRMYPPLHQEISHWFFLETWNDPLPWREERHIRVSLASDASASGWGGLVLSSANTHVSEYWTADSLRNTRVDALVDNQAVVHAWQRQGGRSVSLDGAIKKIFFTTMKLNISLHLMHISTTKNPADAPSRVVYSLDSTLHPDLWKKVQRTFSGPTGHTCDLMALDSNAMLDLQENRLPHFTLHLTPASSGVNVFAQELSRQAPSLEFPYVFPPFSLFWSDTTFTRGSSPLVHPGYHGYISA